MEDDESQNAMLSEVINLFALFRGNSRFKDSFDAWNSASTQSTDNIWRDLVIWRMDTHREVWSPSKFSHSDPERLKSLGDLRLVTYVFLTVFSDWRKLHDVCFDRNVFWINLKLKLFDCGVDFCASNLASLFRRQYGDGFHAVDSTVERFVKEWALIPVSLDVTLAAMIGLIPLLFAHVAFATYNSSLGTTLDDFMCGVTKTTDALSFALRSHGYLSLERCEVVYLHLCRLVDSLQEPFAVFNFDWVKMLMKKHVSRFLSQSAISEFRPVIEDINYAHSIPFALRDKLVSFYV